MRKALLKLLKKEYFFAFLILINASIFAEEKADTKANEFTINYQNVSVLEYIQFVSKVCDVNFLYSAEDLNFNISVVSSDPISRQSVIATLIQILRTNNLHLIENNNSLVISKIEDVKEIAPLVSKDVKDIKNPIITRIFSIKNTSVETLVTIIKGMISTDAIIEALPESRQIIASDVTTNIQKITTLIESIDSTESPLEIKTYSIQANSAITLIALTKQIISPLIGGSPYLLIPQESTGTIYIVSTPMLANKTLAVLKSLDVEPKDEIKTLESQQIFIYQPVYRTLSDLRNALKEIATNLKKEGMPHPGLIDAIDNMKLIQDTNSFVFSASEPTLAKLQKVIAGLDTPTDKEKNLLPTFYLYKLQFVSGEQIEENLEELLKKFKTQKIQDQKLLEVIENTKWVKETNSILLTGNPIAIEEVKNIIAQYDTLKQSKQKGNFFIYSPKHASLDDLDKYLKDVAHNLKSSGLSDPDLIDTIESMRSVSSINSIIFTGGDQTLEKVKSLLSSYDVSKEGQFKGNFLMLTPTHVTLKDLEKAFKDIATNLKSSGLADQPLLESIYSLRAVPTTNSLIFTGDEQTLAKIQSLFNSVNAPTSKQAVQLLGKTNFWVYEIKQARPQHLVSSIKSITSDLSKIDSDKYLLEALKSMRYVKETNSLIFTGTPDALEKLEPLVQKFDVPSSKEEPGSSYFVYKPKYLTGPELEIILNEFAENLKKSNLENDPLYETIESMKWSDQTKTLVFTGDLTAIDEIKNLLQNFDIADIDHPKTHEISGLEDLGFLVYKLQYHKGNDIQEALKQIATDLKTANPDAAPNFKLVKGIDAVQWIKITNSLLCSGDKETLSKVKELISSLDVPLKQVFIEILIIQTTLSNALSFGLDWGSKFQYKDQAVVGINNFGVPADPTNLNPVSPIFNKITNTVTPKGPDLSLGNGFNLGVIGDILFHKGKSFLSLMSLLEALQWDTETSIILTPKIIAQDGKTATIFSGSNIPYTGSVITNTAANTSTTTNLEYRDIGMNLTITPILGNGDAISLTIDLESSATPATETGQVQLGQVTGITTLKTNMSTSVHLANKNFLVLSGMVTDTKTKAKSGIPCLGGIPLIGAAFSKSDDQQSRNNIVIFLRPHLINTYKDMQSITRDQEDIFREHAGTPTLERDFDEATELIKSYENE